MARRILPEVVKLMRHPEPDARVAAAEALLKISPEKHGEAAVGVLVESLRHPDLLVRVRAARALKGRGALPALESACRDPEPEVRKAAEDAIRAR